MLAEKDTSISPLVTRETSLRSVIHPFSGLLATTFNPVLLLWLILVPFLFPYKLCCMFHYVSYSFFFLEHIGKLESISILQSILINLLHQHFLCSKCASASYLVNMGECCTVDICRAANINFITYIDIDS